MGSYGYVERLEEPCIRLPFPLFHFQVRSRPTFKLNLVGSAVVFQILKWGFIYKFQTKNMFVIFWYRKVWCCNIKKDNCYKKTLLPPPPSLHCLSTQQTGESPLYLPWCLLRKPPRQGSRLWFYSLIAHRILWWYSSRRIVSHDDEFWDLFSDRVCIYIYI